ncbi:MAG: hypothetical protein CMJ75_14450 [Planctomycetaceae bacterium]|nr:hypothetical protein [Planctomycetaceae bacterium]
MKNKLALVCLLVLLNGLLLHWPRPLDVAVPALTQAGQTWPVASTHFVSVINQLAHQNVTPDANFAAGLLETIRISNVSEDTRFKEATEKLLGIRVFQGERQLPEFPRAYQARSELGPWTTKQLPVPAQWLNDHRRILEEIQSLCLRDQFRAAYYSPQGEMMKVHLATCTAARQIADIYVARVYHAIGEARLDDAQHDLLTLFRLSRLLAQGYFSVEALTAYHIHSLACQGTTQWLSHPQLAPAQLSRFETQLASIAEHQVPIQVFDIGERFTLIGLLQSIHRRGFVEMAPLGSNVTLAPVFNALLTFADWNQILQRTSQRFDKLVKILMIEDPQERRTAVTTYQQQTQQVYDSFSQRNANAQTLQINKRVEELLSVRLFPTVFQTFNAFLQVRMSRDAVETCIALKKYQLATGDYPDRLDVLASDEQPIPDDIYSGQSLRYIRMTDGAVVYSVGRSRTDHGGWGYSKAAPARDDVVFRIGSDDRLDPAGTAGSLLDIPGSLEFSGTWQGRLTAVSLQGWDITDTDLSAFNTLPHLQSLKLSGTQVSTTGLSHLTNLPQLQILELDSCPQLSDSALVQVAKIRSLKTLNLRDTPITDAGVEYLTSLKKLRTLSIGNSQITEAGVAKLQQALPNCTVTP